MIALLQRVSQANVVVAGVELGRIGAGLMVLLCAERGDCEEQADLLLKKLLNYRVFSDDAGKMNLSLLQTAGGLLLIPQFTLAADTGSGTRPSFSRAAEPAIGRRLFDYFVAHAKKQVSELGCGEFGADMQVSLTNDGPVTLWLQSKPKLSIETGAQ